MIYFPYDNKSAAVQDRNSNSAEFASFIYKLCGYKSGIFEPLGNKGLVKIKNGMTVTVEPLDGAIRGRLFDEVAVRELQLDTGGEQDRIDTVVVRANLNDRTTDLYVVQGAAASLPTRPALRNSGGIFEIGLADIYIPKLSTTITQSRITDTRIDAARMDILPTVNAVDTSAIFNQYQSALDEYLALVDTALDGTAAGHLQNQVDELNAKDTEIVEKTYHLQNQVDELNAKDTEIVEKTYPSDSTLAEFGLGNNGTVDDIFREIVAGPKLLWTNASPTAAFAAQTIREDLSNYAFVEIMSIYGTSEDAIVSDIKIPIGGRGFVQSIFDPRAGSEYARFIERVISVKKSKIEITDAYYKVANAQNAAVGNSFAIPYMIYGIK